MFFRCLSIQAHCNEAGIYLNFGTPKNNEFSILEQMENLLFLGVPILKHIRVNFFSLKIFILFTCKCIK